MTAIRLLVSALAVLTIGGCSAEGDAHHPLRAVVDGKSVFVLNATTRDEATPVADAACKQHGSVAVFHGFMQYRGYRVPRTDSAWFECVPRIA
jgi:hypothetical protein